MKSFFLYLFTWWNKATAGTLFHTWRKGERVGQDEFGNVYYRTRGGALDPALGFERRWVVYANYAEATMIPPGWYGWMHHQIDTPPERRGYAPHHWERPHIPNMTGTRLAYRPSGSTLASGQRPPATGDYEAWSP